ncbi:MAG: hypothetical protein MZV70_69240 [Desulfobacterales bacterium]|nr:hypothetical protein [Desulfobacterales bacterium]
MKGDVDAAVEAGAHALAFFVHGLGHQIEPRRLTTWKTRGRTTSATTRRSSAAPGSGCGACGWPRPPGPGTVITREPGYVFHPGPDRHLEIRKEASRFHQLRQAGSLPVLRRDPARRRRPRDQGRPQGPGQENPQTPVQLAAAVGI